MQYVALLRGINVGGNKKVPMENLREMFASLGFVNVKTLLNSGNVIFDSLETNEKLLTQNLEESFAKKFGFTSKIMLRKMSELAALIKLDPFKTIKITKNIRLYVTFLSEKSNSTLPLPYISAKKDFQILQKTNREVFSVLTVDAARTTDAMNFIEKEYGRDATTRNWNTVKKIAVLSA